jgi:membrane-bound hydrogenase subunit alpha
MPKEITGEVRGDVYDRILVRVHEILQSVEIIEKCLKGMPEGKLAHEDKIPKLLADLRPLRGEGIGRHEAPRGEVFHYVKMVGEEAPFSWKVKAPTYSNLLSWVPMLMGAQVADIPIIAASIDPCMSCANRAVSADGSRKEMDNEALHGLSLQKTLEIRRGLGR